MHHPRQFKPESIANVQLEIQIVDTHESLETPAVIGLLAFGYQLNRTLLIQAIEPQRVVSCASAQATCSRTTALGWSARAASTL